MKALFGSEVKGRRIALDLNDLDTVGSQAVQKPDSLSIHEVRSFKSRAMRRPFTSDPNRAFISPTFSASIRPLNLKTTSPFAALVIFSIDPLLERDSRH